MNIVAAGLGDEFPESNEGWGVQLVPLHEDLVGSSRAALLVLVGAVGALWLIACVNIASLQLVRLGERQKETALRLALGASRGRLLRQFGCESLLLALIGGVLAIPTALGAARLLVLLFPEGIPRFDAPSVDVRLLAFTGLLSLATAIFFGIVPALAGPGAKLATTLKDTGSRSPRWQRFRKVPRRHRARRRGRSPRGGRAAHPELRAAQGGRARIPPGGSGGAPHLARQS